MIPKTSVTLLTAIASSYDSVRWVDFYDRYQPILYTYLNHQFPSLDPDDVIQETMLAFMRKLPKYKYDPALTGAFHNYLIGISKYKALEALRRNIRESEKRNDYEKELSSCPNPEEARAETSESELHRSIAELAIRHFLDDDSVSMQKREVFRRTALTHESPEDVAKAMGISRNYVDQIKARAMTRVREIVSDLKAEVRS